MGTTDVALKELKDPQMLKEFSQEVAILKNLNHPNIVKYYGIYVTSEGSRYIVMEYVSKGSLRSLVIEKKKDLRERDLLRM